MRIMVLGLVLDLEVVSRRTLTMLFDVTLDTRLNIDREELEVS